MTGIALPSGRRIAGRSLRTSPAICPDWALYLALRRPPDPGWDVRWVRWPDFWIPLDADDARHACAEAWRRCSSQRVEVACAGGVGRTGTALAAIAILDGLSPADAIALVRDQYHPRAAETPWQRAWLRRQAPHLRADGIQTGDSESSG